MYFHQRFVPGLAIFSYLVGDESSGEAFVVDPTRDVDEFLSIAAMRGLRIRHVLETHVHADFVCGSRELKDRLGDEVTIHASGMGGDEWTPPYADHVVRDRDEIHVGSLRLQAIHTPGHTPEHVAWALYDETRSRETPWLFFSGDFLFVGDVGRPDLLGVEARKQLAHDLYESVFQRLEGLPEFLEVFPAHGAGSLCGKALGSRSSTTVGFEHRFNPALQPLEEPQWVSRLLAGMPLAPPYFRRMKQVNASGPPIIGRTLPGRRAVSASDVKSLLEGEHLLLDLRNKEAYAAGSVPGSINIPFDPSLPTWAGWVLPYDRPLVLVLNEESDAEQAITHLIRVGFDDITGYLEGGIWEWEAQGYALSRLETMTVHELAGKLEGNNAEKPWVLDVRTDAEWDQGHIPGAQHLHAGLVPNRYEEIPRDRSVAIVCGTGFRSSIAASFLKRQGFTEVANVLGGMSAWQHAGFETETPEPATTTR